MILVTDSLDISELPKDCIIDCSAPGPADDAVEYWRKELDFHVDPERARKYIVSTGGWDPEETAEMDEAQLAGIILYLACNDFNEQLTWEEDNPEKAPEDSSCGCSYFCMTDY